MIKSGDFQEKITRSVPFWQEPKELVSHSLPAPPGPGRAMQAMEMLMVDALVVFFVWAGETLHQIYLKKRVKRN